MNLYVFSARGLFIFSTSLYMSRPIATMMIAVITIAGQNHGLLLMS